MDLQVNIRRKTFSVSIRFLFAVVTLLFALQSTPITSSKSQNQTDGDEQRKLVEAIRRGGYREAAKIKGHYVGTMDPNWDWASFDLETLTKNSAAVVIGVPESSKGQLNSNGEMIMTQFEVRVKETIKGTLAENSVVKVALPGGKVEFDDGTSAELVTPKFERMIEGRKYLLFLYTDSNGSDVYLLTGGPQGLFELKGQAGIKALARSSDPVVKEVQNLNEDGLREKVRDYAHKWPEPGQCCN
jgi:hypothetical protein